MKYQLPPLGTFLRLIEILKEKYEGSNPERLGFIRLYNRLAKATQLTSNDFRVTVLFSACVFEIVSIENQYSFLSPARSRLYELLTKYLNIHGPLGLTQEGRLIYAGVFYHYIKDTLFDDILSDLPWENKSNLLNDITGQIQALLIKQGSAIKHLLEEPPAFCVLEKNIKHLLIEYKKVLSSRWFPNRERQALLTFLEGIDETCRTLYKNERNKIQTNYLQSDLIRHVRLGLVLFALMKINGEYKLLTTKPKSIYGNTLFGSTFFELSLKAINVKHLSQLEPASKITWLRALSMHIKTLKEHNSMISQWSEQDINKLSVFEAEIDDFLIDQEVIMRKPARSVEYLTMLMTYGAQYGITLTLAEAAARTALPSVETAIVGYVSGPVGMVLYSTAGTIIATQLVQLVKERLIPAALASLYAQVLTRIGDTIGQTAAGVITLTFSATTQGLGNLLRFYSKIQTDEKDQEWIMTLLNLPDDIFSKENKEILQNTQDIDLERSTLSLTH